MSLSIRIIVTDRIRTANSESPIAVFRYGCGSELFDAVFARTVETQRLIRANSKNLIGVFYGFSGAEKFNELISARNS